MGFFQSKEDYLRTSQPGDLEHRYTLGCDLPVVLGLTEVRFGTEQLLDVSGGETGEGFEFWLVFVRNDERFTGLEEDPSCGRRTKDCVDEDLGWSEPGEPVEGRASEEVY